MSTIANTSRRSGLVLEIPPKGGDEPHYGRGGSLVRVSLVSEETAVLTQNRRRVYLSHVLLPDKPSQLSLLADQTRHDTRLKSYQPRVCIGLKHRRKNVCHMTLEKT